MNVEQMPPRVGYYFHIIIQYKVASRASGTKVRVTYKSNFWVVGNGFIFIFGIEGTDRQQCLYR